MTDHGHTRGLVHWCARQDFEVFLALGFDHLNGGKDLSGAWHLSAMVRALERSYEGSCSRLVITVPPRHLKSTMASVLFPAWLLGRNPATRIIVASYAQDLADALTRDFRKVVTSDWYACVFPATAQAINRDTTGETTTTAGGYRYAAAVGGVLTGRGADYLICDDLMKAMDAASPQAREKLKRFYDETFLSRLDDKATGRVIIVQQRLHEDDIVAHAKEKDGYVHLNLPAIAVEEQLFELTGGRTHVRHIGEPLNPDRESREVLDRLRNELGARAFECQYQQNPVAPDGGIVRYHDMQFYDEAPPRHEFSRLLLSFDTAISDTPTSAFTAGTAWGLHQGKWYLVDAMRIRQDYSGVLDNILGWSRKWKADTILIENAAMGASLVRDLRRGPARGNVDARVLAITPRESKTVRLMSAADRLYSGRALLPRSAAFMPDLRHELQSFPNGKYDDLCDSLSQAINFIFSRGDLYLRPPGRPPGRPRPAGRSTRSNVSNRDLLDM